ncbi:hypothetical protein, partial [Bacillus thuringiensis]|uniref:hypothetical protein n=1 Tax=Bacillus thuringiensis TaxID=1428 RepID=UPI001A8CEC28
NKKGPDRFYPRFGPLFHLKRCFLFFICFPSKLESSPHYFSFILFISLVFPQARIKKALTASIHGSGLSSI